MLLIKYKRHGLLLISSYIICSILSLTITFLINSHKPTNEEIGRILSIPAVYYIVDLLWIYLYEYLKRRNCNLILFCLSLSIFRTLIAITLYLILLIIDRHDILNITCNLVFFYIMSNLSFINLLIKEEKK